MLLIDKIFNRIGINHFGVDELISYVSKDKMVWELYEKGYTIGLNQCEKESTTKKCMKYKPKNVSELTAFIAAIRPSFKSMYSKFESREKFEYGIAALDKLLQTEQFPYSYILYQEQIMSVLNYGGFPMEQCYSAIKSIAKKHPEKVKPLKQQFLDGFKERLIKEDNVLADEATKASEDVWQIISDSCSYGFNSAHAYCMALDSLYNAWQKANYPYEFYEVMLQHYSDKGNKDKVALIKKEMYEAFGIMEGKYKFGCDNRKFVADIDNGVINPALLSIKDLSQNCADELYQLAFDNKFDNFYDVYKAVSKLPSMNSKKLSILIDIGYFEDFGTVRKLREFMKAVNVLHNKSQFNKDKLPTDYKSYIIKHSEPTEKLYRKFDYDSALKEIWDTIPNDDITIKEKLNMQLKYLGYVQDRIPSLSNEYCLVVGYECKFVNPKIQLYRLCDGNTRTVKVKKVVFEKNPFEVGDIIKVVETKSEGSWKKVGENPDGTPIFEQISNVKEEILKKWAMVK